MTPTTQNHQDNFFTALASVRQHLENYISRNQEENLPSPPPLPHSPLSHLCATLNLSDFERDVLLLCAGMELDPEWEKLCVEANGNRERNYPTFSLAMSALPQPYWNALTSVSPLRRWRLIEIGDSNAITTAPLRINERILHYLMGAPHLDEQLLGIVELVMNCGAIANTLVDSHQKLAEQIVTTWRQAPPPYPIIQLCGDEVTSKRSIAATVGKLLGHDLYAISARKIPQNNQDFYQLLQLWEREASLTESVLLLDCDEISNSDNTQDNTIKSFIEHINSPLIVTTRDKYPPRQRTIITFDVHKPTKIEQQTIWQQALGETTELNGFVNTLVSQFNLTAPEIHAACAKARGSTNTPPSPPLPLLWDSCRAQARPKLDDLAQRIIPSASWDDIVLPEAQLQTLRTIAAHVRQRTHVYQKWGFADKGGRGLGISALFSGVSGTGKTMSAEVLAQELQLDLYRIDLSAVVSKYIGETEKNLRRVFDAAETGATILLFDEADALFGKRSDVKDSHDRYANMEVSYLLQRMEEYQGLAILTTNLKDSIDTAFLRRIRFIVKYSFPDASQREEIWRRVFPKNTPLKDLDFAKLAKLNVAGGNIRNIALNAAFIAADTAEAVEMKHIKAAAEGEYSKLERTVTDAEVRGWV